MRRSVGIRSGGQAAASCQPRLAFRLLELYGVFPAASGVLMSIQFLVIHSFPFMMLSAFLIKDPGRRKLVFRALLLLYTAFAWKTDGLVGIAQFAGLTFSTYYGCVVRQERAELGQLAARWAVSFAAFMVLSQMTGMPSDVGEWASSSKAPLFSSLYFLALGSAESSGFYRSRLVLCLDEAGTGKLDARDIQLKFKSLFTRTAVVEPPSDDDKEENRQSER